MAGTLKNCSGRPNINYSEFLCDYISEISFLPTMTTKGKGIFSDFGCCPMGSSCYCFENGETYGLCSSGWKIV